MVLAPCVPPSCHPVSSLLHGHVTREVSATKAAVVQPPTLPGLSLRPVLSACLPRLLLLSAHHFLTCSRKSSPRSSHPVTQPPRQSHLIFLPMRLCLFLFSCSVILGSLIPTPRWHAPLQVEFLTMRLSPPYSTPCFYLSLWGLALVSVEWLPPSTSRADVLAPRLEPAVKQKVRRCLLHTKFTGPERRRHWPSQLAPLLTSGSFKDASMCSFTEAQAFDHLWHLGPCPHDWKVHRAFQFYLNHNAYCKSS